jgi:hypothetical protein
MIKFVGPPFFLFSLLENIKILNKNNNEIINQFNNYNAAIALLTTYVYGE